MHANLVNNPQYADKYFLINKEVVASHSAILTIRCPDIYKKHIVTKKKKKPHYELETVNYLTTETFVYLLHYLYTGSIYMDLQPPIDPYNLVRLYCASEDYGLSHLKKESHKKLLSSLDKRNVYKVWKLCSDLGIMPERNLTNTFIALHYDELINDKKYGKEFSSLKRPTSEELKQAARSQDIATRDAFKFTRDDRWESHYKQILKKAKNADFVIISDQKPQEGTPCHKCILSGHSIELALLVEKIPNGELITTLTPAAIQSLLNWVYCGERPEEYTVAALLLPFANTLKLPQLAQYCEQALIKSIDHSTVLYILQVIMDLTDTICLTNSGTLEKSHINLFRRSSQVNQVKRACLDYLIKNLPTIDFNPLRQMPPMTAIEVVTAVQNSIGKNWIIDSSTESSTTVEVQTLPSTALAAESAAVAVNAKRIFIDDTEDENSGDVSHLSPSLTPHSESSSDEGSEQELPVVMQSSGVNKIPTGLSAVLRKTELLNESESGEEADSVHGGLAQFVSEGNKLHNPQSPVKLTKLNRKKIHGVKDIEQIFG
jgi:hypothetical protein